MSHQPGRKSLNDSDLNSLNSLPLPLLLFLLPEAGDKLNTSVSDLKGDGKLEVGTNWAVFSLKKP